MEYYSSHINRLIEQLSHLPGIGAKSAQRLAFHIMNMPRDQVEQLTASIVNARENVQYCKCCYTLTDKHCNNKELLSLPYAKTRKHGCPDQSSAVWSSA